MIRISVCRMTPCELVFGSQSFGGIFCLHLEPLNVSTHIPVDTASYLYQYTLRHIYTSTHCVISIPVHTASYLYQYTLRHIYTSTHCVISIPVHAASSIPVHAASYLYQYTLRHICLYQQGCESFQSPVFL
jgi:hypothetical protein